MTHHERIAEISRAIRAWCIARTPTIQDAEDLTQDVLLAMLEAAPNLREEGAFYGFMWGVAGNVYRQWAKRKAHRKECELVESAYEQPWPEDAPEDVALLRRELTLLSRRYREAAVLYYVHGMKTAEIARALSISQSMVKYLLFKARIILKEGMEMERNYGVQSYHPRKLDLRYWGEGPNHYYGAAGTLLKQNILFACYNDALTAEQIALEIGVGLPYMEDDLNALHEVSLLTKDSAGRYRTNIIIFTEDFIRQVQQLIAPDAQAIADRVKNCITEQEEAIRALGFTDCGMNRAAFAWQMSAILLHQAVINIAGDKACPELPRDKWGVPCLCWGVEASAAPVSADADPFCFGASGMENARGDRVQCMDFPIVGPMAHHTLCHWNKGNVLLDIARGSAAALSENDAAIAAELVKKGYVLQKDGLLTANCPVFTASQFQALLAVIDEAAQEIAAIALSIRDKEAALLAEHAPEHLKDIAQAMAYFRLFDDAVSLPMATLYAEHVLSDAKCADLMPTTYIVLAE